MSNLGQKIKEAFTGHHDHDKSDVKTPDVNAPGAFPSDDASTKHHSDHNKLTKEPPEHIRQDEKEVEEKGAQHHTGHSHHDPEPETKQATSDAGNYPYWGNLPREGGQHVHRSDGPDSDPTNQHHGLSKDASLVTGASTAGAGTAAAGYLGSDHSKDQVPGREAQGARTNANDESKSDHASKGAGAAGLAGATYLAARDKNDSDQSEKKLTPEISNATKHTNTSRPAEETKTSTTTQKTSEAATPSKTTSAGDNNSHKKEEEALAAGAGAAGLAGAGYYASQRGDKKDDGKRDAGSHNMPGSNTQTSSHTGTAHHDPAVETQKATSAAGNYPYWSNDDNKTKVTSNTASAEAATPSKTTSSGDNESHRKEQALAAGAGASGLAGAGYLATKNREDHKEEKQSSPTLGQTTSNANEHQTRASTGPHDPEIDTKRATSGAGNYPHWDDQKKDHDDSKGLAAAGIGGAGLAGAGYLASNKTDEPKDQLPGSTRETSSGIAAPGGLAQRDTTSRQVEPTTSGGIHNTVVGAGSSEYSPPVGSSNTATATSHQPQTSSQPSQPIAQAAAKQAWNKQQSDSSNIGEDTSNNNKHSDLKYAAAGTAFGAGAAGLAADYGQGKEHEENPRTDQAEKVAERALGSDGKPHAPSATEGSPSGLTSGAAGLSGQSGSTGSGAKVFHKCDQCGHDNDISRYFNKDAIFRSQH